jgi:hypothetical protein
VLPQHFHAGGAALRQAARKGAAFDNVAAGIEYAEQRGVARDAALNRSLCG